MDIIENLIEKNGITTDDFKDDDVRDQVTEIETDESKHEPSEEEKKEERRLKAMKAKMSLEGKRERKIPVQPDRVEEIIEEFKKKYNINETFDDYFSEQIKTFHKEENKDRIIKGALGDPDHELQFTEGFFQDLVDWVRSQIKSYVKQEFESDPNMPEDKKEVLSNLDIHIGLTVDDAGIDKVTLIAWHYLLKNLERISREFINEHKDELVGYNKQKIAIELYNREVTNILSNHPQMKAFVNTIISITFSWMKKYHAKSSRLSKFIYELQLSDMYVMLNTIVRYLVLIAIKNRNPLELRALMSTYISLIHRNIISLLSADITKVKIGYVAAVQYMFEEGERTHFTYSKHQMLAEALSNIFKIYNKRKLKANNKTLEIFKHVGEMNTLDFFYFMNDEYSILDNMYMYTLLGADLKNSNDKLANGFAYSSAYYNRVNYQPVKKYFDSMYAKNIQDKISGIFEHEKTANVFYNKIKNHTLRSVNPRYYITEDGKQADEDIVRAIEELDVVCKKVEGILS